jgi:predicted HAD superfamily Cof-like phosphohydrolase
VSLFFSLVAHIPDGNAPPTSEGIDMSSNFQRVSRMNEAFDNGQGDPKNIDWKRIQSQSKSIGHEFGELLVALGANKADVSSLVAVIDSLQFGDAVNLEQVRDSLCDIHVFGYGAHHLMGIDADRDMKSVVDAVMTRFVVDEEDRRATLAKHAERGVTDVYFVGEFPTMVMKSASDQPDAPKGKFLKSASYSEPVFYLA